MVQVAASLTRRPMKGMLTGVRLLSCNGASFAMMQPRQGDRRQIAAGVRVEVLDLEARRHWLLFR